NSIGDSLASLSLRRKSQPKSVKSWEITNSSFTPPATNNCASLKIFCSLRDCKFPRINGMAQKAHRFLHPSDIFRYALCLGCEFSLGVLSSCKYVGKLKYFFSVEPDSFFAKMSAIF